MRFVTLGVFRLEVGGVLPSIGTWPHPSLRTIVRRFIMFSRLLFVSANCCFVRRHTIWSVFRFTKYIRPHIVSAMLSCFVLWFAMSGLGRPCGFGSAFQASAVGFLLGRFC